MSRDREVAATEEEEGEEPRDWRKEKFSRGIPTEQAFVIGVLPAAAIAGGNDKVRNQPQLRIIRQVSWGT